VRSDPYGQDFNLPDRKTNDIPTLEAYAAAGARHMLCNVNDVWPHPMPVHGAFKDAMHRMVDAAHKHKLRPYFHMLQQRFPTTVPQFDIHGLHISKRPLRSHVPGHHSVATQYGADSQGTVNFCAKSQALQDAYVHSLARRLDEYADNGLYMDGTAAIEPCKNTLHGCGYTAHDGTVRATYPVFAVRQFMKRIYTTVHQRQPDGVVEMHCSWGYNVSALAYADVYWSGSQWFHLRKTGAKYVTQQLTLDKFRTEFTGRQIGVPCETVTFRLLSRDQKTSQLAATTLLHDVMTRLRSRDEQWFETVSKLWKMRDRFGAEDAQKLFYWNNQDYVTVSPKNCYATLMKHPNNGVLAFISNLHRDTQTVTAQFNLNKLGLRGRELEVFDALTNQAVTMTPDGKLSVPLETEDWIYIWLRPKDAK
jgi:hypothetical protein